jgi:hypothetical protein
MLEALAPERVLAWFRKIRSASTIRELGGFRQRFRDFKDAFRRCQESEGFKRDGAMKCRLNWQGFVP